MSNRIDVFYQKQELFTPAFFGESMLLIFVVIVFFICLSPFCVIYPILPVSQFCPFLIATSGFSIKRLHSDAFESIIKTIRYLLMYMYTYGKMSQLYGMHMKFYVRKVTLTLTMCEMLIKSIHLINTKYNTIVRYTKKFEDIKGITRGCKLMKNRQHDD